MSMSDAFNDPYQEMDDSGKRMADAIREEIDEQIIKDLIELCKRLMEEDYDRAMKGIDTL